MAGRCVITGFAAALALGASFAYAQETKLQTVPADDAQSKETQKQQCLPGALPETALPLNFTKVRPPLDLDCIRAVKKAEGRKSTRAGYHFWYVYDVTPEGVPTNIRKKSIDAECMADQVSDYIARLRYQCSADGAKDMQMSITQTSPHL